jgi:hypothetical protein
MKRLTLEFGLTQFKSTLNLEQAEKIIGGFTSASKMPCFGFSLPAKRCKRGSKLAKIKGTVCNSCYARKNFFNMPSVLEANERRYKNLNHPKWVEACSLLINLTEYTGYYRWFISGDIPSLKALENIIQVAKNTPHIKHWIPSHEFFIIGEYIRKHGKFPDNVTVRLSADFVDGAPPTLLAKRLGVLTSGVSSVGFTCPASKQGNKCLTCRACWNKEIENINYKLH